MQSNAHRGSSSKPILSFLQFRSNFGSRMSITLDNNSSNRGMMEGSGGGGGGGGGGASAHHHGHGVSRISMYESPDQKMMMGGGAGGIIMQHQANNKKNCLLEMGMRVEQQQRKEEVLDSCSSSSIGKNSDLSDGFSDRDDTTEVQSSYKGPLDRMDSLEDVLPIRRGISKFYCGKSKSFTSLACAKSASSIKEIVKPENAYSKRRKNLLASSSLIWDKNRSLSPRSNGGGISKRSTINTSRSTLALAFAMSSSESLNSTSEDSNSNSNSNSTSASPPHLLLPPLHPQSRSSSFHHEPLMSSPSLRRNAMNSWRSYSLADLEGVGVSVTASPPPPCPPPINKDKNN